MFITKLPFDDQDAANAHQVEHWQFFAICGRDGGSQVMDFLDKEAVGGELSTRVAEFFAGVSGMQRQPQGPRDFIGTSRCHQSVRDEPIFEFRHGALRVHWFYGRGQRVVILACAAKKTSNKTPQPLMDRLKKLRRDYEQATETGDIQEI